MHFQSIFPVKTFAAHPTEEVFLSCMNHVMSLYTLLGGEIFPTSFAHVEGDGYSVYILNILDTNGAFSFSSS